MDPVAWAEDFWVQKSQKLNRITWIQQERNLGQAVTKYNLTFGKVSFNVGWVALCIWIAWCWLQYTEMHLMQIDDAHPHTAWHYQTVPFREQNPSASMVTLLTRNATERESLGWSNVAHDDKTSLLQKSICMPLKGSLGSQPPEHDQDN